MEYIVRTMERHELDIAVEWAALEGWNPGLYDADCFYTADPNGFLIGTINHEPIATISAVKYGDSYGFMGFYIVKPEFRGQGYGIQIWQAALKYLKGCNVGLDGVVAQQENYLKSGFKPAYRNVRFEGLTGGQLPNEAHLITLSSISFDAIDTYDQAFFPVSRRAFLEHWLRQPESISLGFVENGRLSGYGMIRVCRKGYKFGPLFADNPQIAETLFLALKASVVTGQPLYLDLPEVNKDALSLANKHGMRMVFETARMYSHGSPKLAIDRLYGVTSFELG